MILYFFKEKFCPNCNTPVRSLRADAHSKLFYSQAISNKQMKAYQDRMSTLRYGFFLFTIYLFFDLYLIDKHKKRMITMIIRLRMKIISKQKKKC